MWVDRIIVYLYARYKIIRKRLFIPRTFLAIQRPFYFVWVKGDDRPLGDKSHIGFICSKNSFVVQWVFAKGFYSDFRAQKQFLSPHKNEGSHGPPPAINRVTTGAWI